MKGALVTSDAKDASDWLPAYRSDAAAQAEAAVDYVESRGRDVLTQPSRRFMSPLRTAAPCGRPAHRLGDCAGRSPDSRVVACALPSRLPSGQSWTQASRSQLRGQPRMDLAGFRVPFYSLGFPGEPAHCKHPQSHRESQAATPAVPKQRGRLAAGLSVQRAIDARDAIQSPTKDLKSTLLNPV
jgi:hypothetical protein